MGALGYVMQVPEEEKYLKTKDELHDEIVIALGGRAAEEVIFNTVTTGAENDIEKATEEARDMITMYGMSKKFGLMQLETVQNRYLDGRREMNCSDSTASKVDKEVMKLLDECYTEAKKIISEHLDAMDKLAQFLIEKETISGKEFMKIYRETEGIPEPEEGGQKAPVRIFATRPESAAVGENIPVKKPEEKHIPDDGENASFEKREEAPQEKPWDTYVPPYVAENVEQRIEAPAPKAEEQKQPEKEADDSQNADHAEDQSSSGSGRFSHTPDRFDQK